MQSTTFQNVSVVATTIIREVHLHELTKIVKSITLATLLKFEQKREHFTTRGMHLNAKGKASAAKLIINWVNCIQKMEKPISLGWQVVCVCFLNRMIVGSVSAAYVEGTCSQNSVCLHGPHCRISEQHLTHTDVNTTVLFLFYGDDTVTPVCCESCERLSW